MQTHRFLLLLFALLLQPVTGEAGAMGAPAGLAGNPRISLPVSAVNFSGSAVDSTSTRLVWVYNAGGSADLAVQVQHPTNSPFVVAPDSLRIAPGDSASLIIKFAPPLCSTYADAFSLVHNDPLCGPLNVSIQGFGKVVRHTDPGTQMAWRSGPIPVSLTFGEPMSGATVSDATISIYGSRSGRHHTKNITVSGDARSAAFEIDGALINEETVTVTLTTGMHTARGSTIPAPYTWSFRMRAPQGTARFGHPTVIGTVPQPVRVLAGDLQNDGFVDLVVSTPELIRICTGSAAGWGSFVGFDSLGSDACPVGAVSLADISGRGGVGISFGTWNNLQTQTVARYLGWDAFPLSQKTFGPIPDFAFGSTAADFDGDGDLDVLFSFLWQHSVQLFRNNGTWPFPSETYAVNGGPYCVASADFDGDGLQDFVASAFGRDDIVFCRNAGGGAFETAARQFVGVNPLPIVVADFNNDGLIDVAVGAYEAGTISLLLNEGDFQFHRTSISVPGKPRSLAAADFNGDGNIDLAAAIEDAGKVMAWVNNGTGVFTKVLEEQVGSAAYGVEAVDNLRDGRARLIVTYDSYIAMMENKTAAPEIDVLPDILTFSNVMVGTKGRAKLWIRNPGTAPLTISDMRGVNAEFSLSCNAFEIPAGDSLCVSVEFSPTGPHAAVDTIRILSNDLHSPVVKLPVYGTVSPVVSLMPAQNGSVQLTGDSIQVNFLEDLDAGSLGAGNVVLSSRWRAFNRSAFSSLAGLSGRSLTYKGLPPFLPGEDLAVTIGPGVRSASQAAPVSPLSWSFRAVSTAGTGAFEPQSSWSDNDMVSPTFLDIDQDGDLDVVYSGWSQTEAVILKNDGSGHFTLQQRISLGKWCSSIACADFDGDGDQDIALSEQAYVNAITILKNEGGGHFTASQPVECPADPGRIIAADFDNDGDADILFSASGSLRALENDGTGQFTLRQVSSPGALDLQAVADFDNNGVLDVCTLKMWPAELAVYSYNGLGMYEKRCDFPVAGSCIQCATVGDFDGDGLCDIALGGLDAEWKCCVMIFKNHGNWDFSLESNVSIHDWPHGLAAGDLDGDGDLDLATADYGDAKATVLLNNGTGQFKQNQMVDIGPDPTCVEVGDLNNDGALDLMVNARTEGVIHFLKNGLVLSVAGHDGTLPRAFSLEQNYPNPFNPSTTIRYVLPRRSHVALTVYSTLGQQIATLVNADCSAGSHTVQFDGSGLSSGVYFYRIQAGDFVQTRKLLLVR